MGIELCSGARLAALVSWEIIVFCFAYMFLAFSATNRERTKSKFPQELCRASLIVLVFYSWLSFLANIYSSLAVCMMDTQTNSEYMRECQSFGFQDACLKAVTHVNRISSAMNRCPSLVLGNSLGAMYTFLVVFARFLMTSLYGTWNLYTWDSSRFVAGGWPSSPVIILNIKILMTVSLVVLVASMVEISIVDIKPLSSPFSILFLVAIVALGTNRPFTRLHLDLQKTLLYSTIFFSLLDTSHRMMDIVMTCFNSSDIEKYIASHCKNSFDQNGPQNCYSSLNQLDPTYFMREGCPSSIFAETRVVILYSANMIKVVTLCIGLIMSFALGKKS